MTSETCKNLFRVNDYSKINRTRRSEVFAVASFGALLHFTGILWVATFYYSARRGPEADPSSGIPPHRWLVAIVVPVFVASRCYARNTITLSGAILFLFFGFFITLSSYCFAAGWIVFFMSTSRASEIHAGQKREAEKSYRDWRHVISGGIVPAQFAFFYVLDVGYGERPIDFIEDYRASYLSMAFLGAVSCACGDSWSAELGSVVETTPCRLVTTGDVVPRGTHGGVSVGGFAFSIVGGLIVGLAFYITLLVYLPIHVIISAPRQWPVVLTCGIGGLLGSLIDSILGASFQFSGVDSLTGKIVERGGPEIERISGFQLLDNFSVNLFSALLTAFAVAEISKYGWS